MYVYSTTLGAEGKEHKSAMVTEGEERCKKQGVLQYSYTLSHPPPNTL